MEIKIPNSFTGLHQLDKKNAFQRIQNSNGEWRETEEEIQDIVTTYFSELFQSSCSDSKLTERETVNRVTDVENSLLVAEVTTEEVKNVVDSMCP